MQEAGGKEERVRTALLHVAACASIEREEAVVHLLARERHGELTTLEGIEDHSLLESLDLGQRKGSVCLLSR